jgi:hypothetical protein
VWNWKKKKRKKKSHLMVSDGVCGGGKFNKIWDGIRFFFLAVVF